MTAHSHGDPGLECTFEQQFGQVCPYADRRFWPTSVCIVCGEPDGHLPGCKRGSKPPLTEGHGRSAPTSRPVVAEHEFSYYGTRDPGLRRWCPRHREYHDGVMAECSCGVVHRLEGGHTTSQFIRLTCNDAGLT